MKWLAPAKINLSLRVLGRRSDGFHEIETLMVPLSLADGLEINPLPDHPPGEVTLTCNDPTLPTGRDNLAYRAATLFRDRFEGEMPAIRIELTKHIPHGAGLGGGSSDAATVLLALNEICGKPRQMDQLAKLAAELGSDVPFFVFRSAAFCRGRGEEVEPTSFTTALSLLLIKPPFPIPTPWAYQTWRDSRELPGVPYATQAFPWGALVNDLERPVFEKYLVLAELKRWLLEQPEVKGALLSGSGSTMLAILDEHETSAQMLSERVRARFGDLWTHACQVMTSPAEGTSTAIPIADAGL